METHIPVPRKHIDAFGHAFFRQDDKLACAPLLAGGSVDWDWQAESSKRNRAVRNSAGEWLDQHALDSRCGLVLNARKHV